VSGGDSAVRTVDSISRYPERIALLVNKGSGSSSEFFTFESKQSKKVTRFGQNTAGVMDYGEVQEFNLSCGQYIVSVPWGQNGWIERFGFRIDNIGFVPDVPIPSTERNWVRFVVDQWSK
jgi:C-terminal processing protease CtpA/Prc